MFVVICDGEGVDWFLASLKPRHGHGHGWKANMCINKYEN